MNLREVERTRAQPCSLDSPKGEVRGEEINRPECKFRNGGLRSYLSRKIFERTEIEMDFGSVIKALKEGKKVAREGWNGKGMFLLLIDPYLNNQYHVREEPGIVGTLVSYIAMKTADNKLVPWLASQTDVLAEDWRIVE